jgi:hypothetical protein
LPALVAMAALCAEQFAGVLDWRIRLDGKSDKLGKQLRHRRNVGVRQLADANDVVGKQGGRARQQVMAVARVLIQVREPDAAPAAGFVDDRCWHTQELAVLDNGLHDPRCPVLRASGTGGHDDFDVPFGRPIRRVNARLEGRERQETARVRGVFPPLVQLRLHVLTLLTQPDVLA